MVTRDETDADLLNREWDRIAGFRLPPGPADGTIAALLRADDAPQPSADFLSALRQDLLARHEPAVSASARPSIASLRITAAPTMRADRLPRPVKLVVLATLVAVLVLFLLAVSGESGGVPSAATAASASASSMPVETAARSDPTAPTGPTSVAPTPMGGPTGRPGSTGAAS